MLIVSERFYEKIESYINLIEIKLIIVLYFLNHCYDISPNLINNSNYYPEKYNNI